MQWTASYSSQSGSSLVPYALVVHGTGNVYVAGVTVRPDFSTGIAVLKYENVVVSVKEDKGEGRRHLHLNRTIPIHSIRRQQYVSQ